MDVCCPHLLDIIYYVYIYMYILYSLRAIEANGQVSSLSVIRHRSLAFCSLHLRRLMTLVMLL